MIVQNVLPCNAAVSQQKSFLNAHTGTQKVNSSGNHTSEHISCTQLHQIVIKIQDGRYSIIDIFLCCHCAKLLCFYIGCKSVSVQKGGRI
jgi:hypothetical protein